MTVVLGYVPTPAGRAALAAAIEEARLRDTSLVVLNTSRADRLVDPRYAGETDLGELAQELAASGVPHEVRQHLSGQLAGDELVDLAAELNATLLVIALRRRTPVGKLLLGSAAQTVLLDAACPVLAVKEPPSS